MNGRDTRLKAIRRIITESRVSSQDQLLHRLEREGVRVTQATLSRDLKILQVGKVPDAGGEYHYALSEADGESLRGYMEDIKRGCLSVAFSGNLGVMKTITGHADAVAGAIDKLVFPELLGTAAGDDTVLMVLKEDAGDGDGDISANRTALTRRLSELIGDTENGE